jgi:hypothetical protein
LSKLRRPLNVIHGNDRFTKFNRARDNSDAPRRIDNGLDCGEELLRQLIHRNVLLQQTTQNHGFLGSYAHALPEYRIESTHGIADCE